MLGIQMMKYVASLWLAATPTTPSKTAPAPAPSKQPVVISKDPPLKIGVVSVEGRASADSDANRLSAYLGKVLNRQTEAKVYTDYVHFANDFEMGRVDVAWLPPVLTVRALLVDARLLAKVVRNGTPTYRAVLFTRSDAKFATIKDLKKVKVAWVDKASAAGYVFPVALLSNEKMHAKQLFTKQSFLGSHDAVCKAVATGEADLGATFADENAPTQINGCQQSLGEASSKLKVVATTEKIPSDVIAIRPDIETAVQDSVRKAVLAMGNDDEGKKLLSEVFHAEKLTDVNPSDYESVAAAMEVADRFK
jgi:phosphate/phosphite/phosphonate ABC transporter binding protein